MGRRRTLRRVKVLDWRYRLGTLLLIIAGITIPVLGTVAIQVWSYLPDLSELVVRPDLAAEMSGSVDWPSLKDRQPGSRVRILGYMMDNVKPIPNGLSVANFVLMPEAGTLLHPAHRIPEEMIDIQLRNATAIVFTVRLLVWINGTLTRVPPGTGERQPLYRLSDATVQIAAERDIQRYFCHSGSC